MNGLERSLFGLFSACWIVDLLHLAGWLRLPAGVISLSLYGFYGVAAAAGWLAGNVWMARRRGLRKRSKVPAAPPVNWQVLVFYLLGPLSVLYFLRALAPSEVRAAAPLVPLWAFFVYGVFFLVPVTLTPRGR